MIAMGHQPVMAKFMNIAPTKIVKYRNLMLTCKANTPEASTKNPPTK
jgi:hypothetical protein